MLTTHQNIYKCVLAHLKLLTHKLHQSCLTLEWVRLSTVNNANQLLYKTLWTFTTNYVHLQTHNLAQISTFILRNLPKLVIYSNSYLELYITVTNLGKFLRINVDIWVKLSADVIWVGHTFFNVSDQRRLVCISLKLWKWIWNFSSWCSASRYIISCYCRWWIDKSTCHTVSIRTVHLLCGLSCESLDLQTD